MHLVAFVDSSCLYQNNRVLSKSWPSQCNEGKQKQMSVKCTLFVDAFKQEEESLLFWFSAFGFDDISPPQIIHYTPDKTTKSLLFNY